MEWSYKRIRKNSWDTAFNRGWRAWLALVAVLFLFSWIGAAHSSQTSFVDTADQVLGLGDQDIPDSIEFLKEYIVSTPLAKTFPFLTSDLAMSIFDSVTRSYSWVIRLFTLNMAYFQRNPGEVIGNLIIVSIITTAVRFLFQNVAVVGRNRYVMETRFSKNVPVGRIFAPFDKKNLGNVVWVMVCYHVALALWSITVIGGVYKRIQYGMVPYILAENPSVKWRDAKKLSASMTKGYKWKMFVTWLSYLYIWVLQVLPLVGLLVAVPLNTELDSELYFTLRANPAVDHSYFIEPAFSAQPVVVSGTRKEPMYLMKDIKIEPPQSVVGKPPYGVTDAVFFFMIFCFVGWVWEVGLVLFQEGILTNRGTMHGPWIPIYGFGGTSIVFLLNRFKDNKLKLFTSAVLLCAVLEYLGSFLLDFLFNSSYWDYKTMFMNLNGRICLAGLVAFGIGGMFAVYIAAPAIANFVRRYSKRTRIIAAVILAALFITDLICCMLFGFNSGTGVGGAI